MIGPAEAREIADAIKFCTDNIRREVAALDAIHAAMEKLNGDRPLPPTGEPS